MILSILLHGCVFIFICCTVFLEEINLIAGIIILDYVNCNRHFSPSFLLFIARQKFTFFFANTPAEAEFALHRALGTFGSLVSAARFLMHFFSK